MPRALIIVLDSLGVGHAPDAAEYGDSGADTLGHIFESIPDLQLPILEALGIGAIRRGAAGEDPGFQPGGLPSSVGWMREASAGKDTTTGHWEIAGQIIRDPFATFESFPRRIVDPIEKGAGVEFIGNYAQSGTVILEELGAEHLATGKPILYTSADSVIQIAAHEDVIPPGELYEICKVARGVADAERIGRVIARPFGGKEGGFERTANRKDFSLLPPTTVLNLLAEAGHPVISVGKISDIFAGSGITLSQPTKSNGEGMAAIDAQWGALEEGLVFANLVDFDMLYGHRRDPIGYAGALREFDTWLGGFLPEIRKDDLVVITADHGNDPTWKGTDHTREQVPLLVFQGTRCEVLGARETFADVGASIASFFGTPPTADGTSFL